MCPLHTTRCPLPARNVRTVGAKRFCEPAFDHIYTDFETPRMYSRFHVVAKGFGRFYGRVRLRAISPTVGNFSQTQSSAKVSLPYPASRVSHLHTIEVFDLEERFLPARGHVWLTPAGELPVDLAACGPSVGIGGCESRMIKWAEDELIGLGEGNVSLSPAEFFFAALQAFKHSWTDDKIVEYPRLSLLTRHLAFVINEGHRLLGRANDCRRVLAGLALLLTPYERVVAKWLYEQAVMPVGPTRGLCMHTPPTPAEDYSCSRPMNRPLLLSLHPTFLNPMAYLAPPPSSSQVSWSAKLLPDVAPEPLLRRVGFDPETQLVRPPCGGFKHKSNMCPTCAMHASTQWCI